MNGVQAQQEAELLFAGMHADLLLTFDMSELCKVIAAYMRTEGIKKVNLASDDEHDYLVLMEQAFVELYNRGALVPAAGRPFSSSGQSDLNTLLKTYRVTPASEKPVVVSVDPFEQVVKDHNELPSAQLKAKIFADPVYATLYETACSNGRIRSYVR